MNTNTIEIKNLIEQQGEAFSSFKQHLEQRLSAIEGKHNRMSLGGAVGGDRTGAINGAEAKAEFSGFVRKGIVPAERKALSTATDSDGGYAVPMEIDNSIESLLLEISPMRQLARVVPATTSDFKTLVNKRGTASGWVGEEAARSETDTPDLAEVSYPSGEIYAFPMATQRSLEDFAFDAEAWLQNEIADEFALKEGAAFVTGDGTNKPKGFLAYSTAATADGVRAFGALQHVITTSDSGLPTSNPGDVLIALMHSLRSGYRRGAAWLMNTNTLSVIAKLKDGDGNYLWRPAFSEGQPSTLLGYPVYEDENMPDIAMDALPVAFGNFQRAYTIVDRTGTSILRDPFTKKGYVGFYSRKRVSGALVNSEAVKVLKVSAT